MNPYEVLEISPSASPDEVKAAYHRLAKKWHPDRFSGAEKAQAEIKFQEITEAFTLLKDAPKRPEADSRPAPQAPIQLQTEGISRVPPQERTTEDWFNDAKAALDGKDPNRALALIQFALRLDANKAEYHLLHARILEATGGDKKVLVKALETAVRLNPRDVDATVKLAETFQAVGMYARASAMWQKAHDLNPNHPVFHQDASNPGATKDKASGIQGLKEQLTLLVEQAKAFFNRFSKRG